LDDRACQMIQSMQRFAHHGLRQAIQYTAKEKVATKILVQWAMIGQYRVAVYDQSDGWMLFIPLHALIPLL